MKSMKISTSITRNVSSPFIKRSVYVDCGVDPSCYNWQIFLHSALLLLWRFFFHINENYHLIKWNALEIWPCHCLRIFNTDTCPKFYSQGIPSSKLPPHYCLLASLHSFFAFCNWRKIASKAAPDQKWRSKIANCMMGSLLVVQQLAMASAG